VTVSHASAASDGALVQALHDGDDEAFAEVFRRYYPTVYGVLLRITGVPDEAEDLTQEVFLRLYQRPVPLGTDVNLAGWLYRVASNLGFNAVRSRRRLRDRVLRWARLERPLVTGAPNPAAEAERSDAAARVRQALAELPERDRTVLILRHSGVSYAEIAAAVGIRTSSVGTVLARAERALRARYLARNPGAGEE
jgi:RNA polymerase sigma-70 factor (ECF subfamily)